jgi:hypothetical protein
MWLEENKYYLCNKFILVKLENKEVTKTSTKKKEWQKIDYIKNNIFLWESLEGVKTFLFNVEKHIFLMSIIKHQECDK